MVERPNKVFGLIIHRFEDIFHSFYACEVIRGVTIAASRLKADVTIHITESLSSDIWVASLLARPKYLDGIIFADINGQIQVIKKFANKDIPFLVMNNFVTGPINCISIDNKSGAISALDYLIELGHKRIATICGNMSTEAAKKRLEGYKEALKRHNLKIEDSLVKNGEFLRTPARLAAEELLKSKNPPTAIFAASDVMALEVLEAAKNLKIKVPEQLSIIGFDDNPLSVYSPVPLTTVSQPLMEMGRLALENLNQVVIKRQKTPVKIILPTRLIKRKSCQMRT
ncbi:MAG: substrate-binding domain-containing protein [Candidatus Omnitrophota bacterium]